MTQFFYWVYQFTEGQWTYVEMACAYAHMPDPLDDVYKTFKSREEAEAYAKSRGALPAYF